MAGRRAARRTALFLLYQWDLTGQPLATNYEGEVDEFALCLAEAVVAHADELDARITEVSGETSSALACTSSRKVRSRSKWRSTRQSPLPRSTHPRMRGDS